MVLIFQPNLFFIMSYNQRKFNAILKIIKIKDKYNISYIEIEEVLKYHNEV